MIPYSAEVFLAISAEYNLSIWPIQAVAVLLGLFAAGLGAFRPERPGWPQWLLLAAAWCWCGLAYELGEFAAINFWAYGFAGAFLLQGLLFLWAGVRHQGSRPATTGRGAVAWTGVTMMFVALVAHPMLSTGLGRDLSEASYFGTAPGPTVLFTLGALLHLRPAAPLYLFFFPVLWCVISGGVALELGIHEDLLLPLAGVLTIALLALGRGAAGPRARRN